MQPIFGATDARQVSFMGPFGVGKTTAVRTISAVEVATTEADSTMASLGGGRHLKPTTTVGLEYGEWRAPDGGRVAVVGTPGQARFDAVRRSAVPRSAGIVLWLFGHHQEAPLDCQLWTEFLGSEGVPARKLTVAVTRLPEDRPLEVFADVVATVAGPEVPVLAADPRDPGDVERVLLASLRAGGGAPVRPVPSAAPPPVPDPGAPSSAYRSRLA